MGIEINIFFEFPVETRCIASKSGQVANMFHKTKTLLLIVMITLMVLDAILRV
ncbi:MAG: hypothetical protein JWQ54_5187 [Mucilaginibacter sp.]|nr:hypothetical protein [Mucilaginibacter sp.]